jgi:hypothetical protein
VELFFGSGAAWSSPKHAHALTRTQVVATLATVALYLRALMSRQGRHSRCRIVTSHIRRTVLHAVYSTP